MERADIQILHSVFFEHPEKGATSVLKLSSFEILPRVQIAYKGVVLMVERKITYQLPISASQPGIDPF